MKKLLLPVFILFVAGFVFIVNVPVVFAADDGDKYIAMYRAFLRDFEGKQYKQVWDSMSLSSKNALAKVVSSKIVTENRKATQADVLKKLENDTANLRTNYLDSWNENFNDKSFYKELANAEFKLKSVSPKLVVITIEINKEPKDFQIIREAGKWKINFFADLMR
jgi:hypothetical protein